MPSEKVEGARRAVADAARVAAMAVGRRIREAVDGAAAAAAEAHAKGLPAAGVIRAGARAACRKICGGAP